jgi:hypothetical protein
VRRFDSARFTSLRVATELILITGTNMLLPLGRVAEVQPTLQLQSADAFWAVHDQIFISDNISLPARQRLVKHCPFTTARCFPNGIL